MDSDAELIVNIEHRYSMSELFPVFLDTYDAKMLQLKPSTYISELQLSTEERMQKLIKPFRKCNSFESQEMEMVTPFTPIPRIIIFQNYIPGKIYSAQLLVRNDTHVLKPLQVIYKNTPNFSVIPSVKKLSFLAPGMSVSFKIQFSPDKKQDYTHNIKFYSCEEHFIVPIAAIGPRPMLDFPDQIELPCTPVKIPVTKYFLVKNIGEIEAVFSLSTDSPFAVEPKSGRVQPGGAMEWCLALQSQTVGDFCKLLTVSYETGESVHIKLHGTAGKANVYLEKNCVVIGDTFMGLKRESSFLIFNKTEHIVNFRWKRFPDPAHDIVEIERLKEGFQMVRDLEMKKYMQLKHLCHVDSKAHEIVYNRIYSDEIEALEQQELDFKDRNFILLPGSGEIWPDNWIEITVIFMPDKAQDFCIQAYCDILGAEHRIPLTITGVGQGPLLKLNVRSLDAGNIVAQAFHSYEIVVTNSGDIPGTIKFMSSPILFGGKIYCDPKKFHLNPDDYKTFIITFNSRTLGHFEEHIKFLIEESNEVLQFTLKGDIIIPVLHFNKKIVNLNDVGIGFPVSCNIALHNLSPVCVQISLAVKPDGLEESLTYKDFFNMETKEILPPCPKEIMLHPLNATLEAENCLNIKVTVTANAVGRHYANLIMHMKDLDAEPLTLPIVFSAKLADIQCSTKEIYIKHCFINLPYKREIVLNNSSNVPGAFIICSQEVDNEDGVMVSLPRRQGLVKPGGRTKVPVFIMTNAVGTRKTSVNFLIMGNAYPSTSCHIICDGEGPVISVVPLELPWGETRLLKPSMKEVKVINDGPIPATIEVNLVKSKTPWSISPTNFMLSPDETKVIEVVIYLIDTGNYSDTMEVKVTNSRTITVNLTATGIGTSITVEPSIETVDIGLMYISQKIVKEFVAENKGTRHHQLLWSPFAEVKDIAKGPTEFPENSVFCLEPCKFDLAAKEQETFYLKVECPEICTKTEKIYCHGVINYKEKRLALLVAEITATFIEPIIEFSKEKLAFRLDMWPNETLHILTDSVIISDVTELPITITLEVEYPFFLSFDNRSLSDHVVYLEKTSSLEVFILFDPAYKDDKYCRKIKSSLLVTAHETPFKISLPLEGEVNFPNVKIDRNCIDFGCIPIGTDGYEDVIVQNVSPLPVIYRWYLSYEQDDSFTVEPLPLPIENNDSPTLRPSKMETFETDAEIVEEEVPDDGLWFDKVPDRVRISYVEREGSENKLHSPDGRAPAEELLPAENLISPQSSSSVFAESSSTESTESLRRKANSRVLKQILVPSVICYFEEVRDGEVLKKLPRTQNILNPINQAFEISPSYGYIEPYGEEIVRVAFNGYTYLSQEVMAVIEVENGPSETIMIKGKASEIRYNLSSTTLTVGNTLFCDVCEKKMVISNTGILGFTYSVTSSICESDLRVCESPLERDALSVRPQSGYLEKDEFKELIVQYFPGVPGKFRRTFSLQIGFLNPVDIVIEGKGVFPQVQIMLPRSMSYYPPSETTYAAITNLCHNWSEQKEKFTCQQKEKLIAALRSAFCMSEEDLMDLKEDNWIVVSREDNFPSAVCIDLEVERVIATDVARRILFSMSEVKGKSQKTLPEFRVPPYYLDFGPVIIGEQASQNVVILNPGPLQLTIALPQNQEELAESGVFVMLDRVLFLAPGDTATLSVSFEPVPDNYSEKITEVDKVLNLEVSYGAIVPIILHATVTVPFVTTSLEFLDFGEVKCGTCKVMHFYLVNEGRVPCKWKIDFLPQWNIKKKHKQRLTTEETVHMFYTKQKADTYEPNQFGLIEVIFEPLSAGFHDSVIGIKMEQNPEEIFIKMEGKGIEPEIVIDKSLLGFWPVDPYADEVIEMFSVTNPTDFPVEIFLEGFDRQYEAEEKVLTSLCYFYKEETLYLPIRTPGYQICNEFQSFYDRIVALISEKLSERKEDDIIAAVSDDGRYPAPLNTEFSLDISQADTLTKTSLHSSLPCLEMPAQDNDLSSKLHNILSAAEGDLDTVLQACIEELRKEECFPLLAEDPIKEALKQLKVEPDTSQKQSYSACIVFHGAPSTDCLYNAHHTGKLLGFSVLNIDLIIVEAAAYGIHANDVQVREAIINNYDLYDETVQTNAEESNDEETQENLEVDPQEFFNSLKEKVKTLNDRRKFSPKDKFSKKLGQKPPKQTPRSTASQKSKKRDAFDVVEGLLPEIPNEIFIEILTRRFASLEQPFGVIIESLDSVFLCPETTALLAVFQAVGNVKLLHCVILYDTFARYFQRKEEAENRKKEAELDKIAYLEQMVAEEISDLSDDDVILYNKLQLQKRKENFKLKKEEMETRKEMRILQLQKKKNLAAGKKFGKGSQKAVPPKSIAGKGRLSEAGGKSTKPPVSSVASVISKKKTASILTPEQLQLKELQMQFSYFEQRIPQLLLIIENWDRRLGVLSESEEKHSPKGKSFKKEKTSSRSATQTASIPTDPEGNVTNDEEILNKQLLGASLWIYNYFYETSDHIQYIGTHLKETSDLERFQIALEESKKLKLPEVELFKCYHEKKPSEKQIDTSVFVIEPQPFVSQICDVLDATKATDALPLEKGKKRKKSRTTTASAVSQASVQKQDGFANSQGDASSTRWLLQPGDSVQFKVQFCPKAVGEYSHEFRIGVTDWSAVHTVDCYGLCDLPRIDDDPYVMFDKVEENKPENKIYKCTYFLSKGVFDFGAVVATKPKDRKAIPTKGSIHISNCSTLTVDAQFSFMEMEPDEADVFSLEPMSLTVEPGGNEVLNIFVCPRSLGIVERTLVCSIKDNPVLMFIKIVCYGVKVDFEVDPKNVSFDYMLLYRKDSRILTLRNKTLVPFLWRFVGTEMLENDFKISDTMAIIKPLENQLIEFTYCATEVQMIARKPLKLEVFEEEGRGDPLCTETILISAEAVDAKVDILFAPKCNHVYFGKLKVGREYEHPMNLKNKGKYELFYKIRIEGQTHLSLEELENIITVLPDNGIVPPGDKPFPVKVLCLPKSEVNIKELPLLTCHFLERGTLVSVIPINVTLQSFSSRFVISPMPDVIFPPQLIGTSKILELTIKNVGELDFKYDLKRLKAPPSEETLLLTTGKSTAVSGKTTSKKQESKSAKSKSSAKGKRVDLSSLLADYFTLTPCTGVIEPQSSAVITVSFCADVEGKFLEEIIVQVSEPLPLDESSTIINLHGISCLPAVDLNNAESMFQDHYICDYVNAFVCPEKVEEHCLYVKEEHRLIFNKVALGSKLSAAIWFHNPGFVTCDLAAILIPPDGQQNEEVSFHISPKNFCVSPQTTEKLLVTFQPRSLKLSECMLELTVEVPVPNRSQKILILLEGEPVVPEIKVILPANIENTEIPLAFLQTPVNQSSNRTLKIANIGVISCEVVVEFSENSDNVFNLVPDKETSQLLQNSLPDESIQQSTMLKIYPNQTASFEINFHPERMGNFTGQLNVTAVLNPFEVHTINVVGEGYVEEIVIQGLGSVMPEDTVTDEDMPVKVYYHLDFGYCYPERTREMCFKIQNMSEDVYKFEWSPYENLKLSPSAGHLKPGASKEIIATFQSPEPITITKEKLNCMVYKIIWYYPAKCSDNTWDNAQDVVCWTWNGSGSFSSSLTSCHLMTDTLMQVKCVEPAGEPKYDVIDGTKQNLIVLLSAISDYSSITFSVEDVSFNDTFLYQTSEHKVILKNDGTVPSSFVMEIIMTDINYIPQPSWLSGKQQSLQALATNNRSVSSVDQLGSQLSYNSNRRTRSSFPSETMHNAQCTEGEYEIPFTVIPKEGTIQPMQEMECCIKFSPCFLFEYKCTLLCRVLNSHPDMEKPSLTMYGSTLVPVCHFQIEESDYLSSGRRIPSLPGPCRIGNDISLVPGAQLNTDTKVIEFKSLGFGHPCVRKFDVLNPTELNFHYFWHRLSKYVSERDFPFQCDTLSGWLASGHKTTASFSFLSEEAGIYESFWYFCVPELETEIPFLLVGTVTEPCVYFENTNLQFESTFTNVKTSVNTHLVNCETVPITFKFDSYSLYSDQNLEHVTVKPLSGRIPPNSDLLISVGYMPTVAGTMNFRLVCSVSYLKNPLYLTVSGTVYNIHPIIAWKSGSKTSEVLSMNDVNVIDIEEVVPCRPLRVVFSLTNAGKATFCYHWILDVSDMKQKNLKVTPSEAKGYVNSHLTTECILTVTFKKKSPLTEYPFSLQIVNGPEYRLLLRGAAVLPQYNVSFTEYNFGPCLIFNSDIFYYHTTLIFSNEENSSMTIDCSFVNKPYLTVEIYDDLIAPRQQTEILISFKPLNTIRYKEVIELLINGVHCQKILITGEGAHLRVQLLKAKQKQIDLGLLQVGQTSEKHVSVINKSVTSVPVSFYICKEFKIGVIPEESKVVTEEGFLQILPREVITIKPQKVIDITVTFTAVARMSFHRMIIMKVFDHIEPLCILKGICADYEFKFNRDYIYFGVVCEGSHSKQTLSLRNTGDIGSRFTWQQNSFDDNFDIKPVTGYSSPGSEVVFTVSYHPKEEQEHIRKIILCEIENYKIMELVVSGTCTALPEPKDVLNFITNVRNVDTKTIEISNTTCKIWEIYPVITGEYFTGAEVLSVPAFSKAPYNITYNPQIMTKGEKHMGTALFRLPETGVILYELNGTSQPPPASSNLEIEVPCKTDYTGSIIARNWLDKTQRFNVFTELIKPDKYDPIFNMSGAEYIDIPAKSTREYQFHFFVFRECTLTFKVTFINEDTEEYEFHELLIRAVKCGPLESINLTACVRQSGTNHIILQNPTINNVTYTAICTASDVFFTSPCIVPSNSEVEFSITYMPLFPGEFTERIEVTCTELGSFPYELLLTAMPALPEKPLHLNCTLGSNVTAHVAVENKANIKAIFNSEIDNSDFKVEKVIALEPGEIKDFPIVFEPSNLGTVSATLAITSPVAGNFSFPVIGKCDFPKPQGPFILTPGASVNINFKNIFRAAKKFNVTVNQPVFSLKKTGDTIPAKKELPIKVTLTAAGKKNMVFPIYGKLVVTCDDIEMNNIQWTYYLKGVMEP